MLQRIYLALRNLAYKNRRQVRSGNQLKLPRSAERLMKKTTIRLRGSNNQLIFGEGAQVTNCEIRLYGEGNLIEIGENVRFKSGRIFLIAGRGQYIRIGSETTVERAFLLIDESANIDIGRDCMLSTEIIIRTGDKHSILDMDTGERLNPSGDVRVGDRVWVGRAVQILKGSTLLPESVVAACSVVTKSFEEGNCVLAGVPAKVVKRGIRWDRDKL